MRLKTVYIENFRGYKNRVSIDVSDLTALVGKNDIGKSTIMEALDIFFNDGKGVIKIDKTDVNVENLQNGDTDVKIGAIFTELPETVVLDGTFETKLSEEYLLDEDGNLDVLKVFKNGDSKATSIKVFINANHPSNPECRDLLQRKNEGLKKIIEKLGIECNKSINAEMRAAIWTYYANDLRCQYTPIDVSSKDGDIKGVWDRLHDYLPLYSLFQSDRKNSDSDDEVQDPLKAAIREIFREPSIQNALAEIDERVRAKVQSVANLTLAKLREMSEEISESLHPKIPSVDSLKWTDVYKGLSISGDNDISINKRGSGVKRLVLLNFFRAEAERRKVENHYTDVIYAIEEPETSQHKEHQVMLVQALKQLANESRTQVLITTHSSEIVKNLDFSNLRMIAKVEGNLDVIPFVSNCLPTPSLNEANYNAFGDISTEFHNELYGYLQAQAMTEDAKYEQEKNFEAWLENKGCIKNKNWIRIYRGNVQPACPVTLQTYVRNCIHHPENNYNIPFTKEELKQSLDKLVSIARGLVVTTI
ncbi:MULTISPECIES: ATP-binding protein [unclassified Fibrobacter]|uniref:ATP-binding protein n=1 Tax=unclassified Fibrobacter TaxID=2634177 RepID=UPI0009190C96|nr:MULTISPECIES: ATP-binding protein [Fibrobacter]MCL4101734.1 hypothetical protein [Fibrobacter succinogenes]OWV02665.1 hypothetical protein B7993_14895 [Fibrobacter sp. UWH3]SHL33322.1 AAA ATPase domain-containing protein [Fibrobacter sp. UWH6]